MWFSKAAVGVAVGLVLFGSGIRSDAVEIGEDDFRISNVGNDGEDAFKAAFPAIALNSNDQEYLVVWQADDSDFGLADQEFEIFGQRIDAATGTLLGDTFRISDVGPDGSPDFGAIEPRVAYNATDNEYLVVWRGDDNVGGLVDNELEIFGQRLSAEGTEVGDNDFRISQTGPDGNTAFQAFDPDVAYNVDNNEYLVVWDGEEVDGDSEIFGQRINAATGVAVGDDDFRVSQNTDVADTDSDDDPSVAYNSTSQEYLVVWGGFVAISQAEIFAQRVAADSGDVLEADDIQISNRGSSSQDFASVAYDRRDNQYLVVWEGNSLVDGSGSEIFGQRLDASASEIGDDDFQVSNVGANADDEFHGFGPSVVYNPANNEYLVAWEGDPGLAPLVDDEFEISGQRLNASTGAEIGGDFQISATGPDGDPNFGAFISNPAYDPTRNTYLVVFEADDDTGALVDDESEIFGQFLRDAKCDNGVVEDENDETCDDGNTVDGDGCDSSCLVEEDDGGGDAGGGCSLIR